MGALSLGPLAAARLLKYTGLGAKLAPKVAKTLTRLDDALAGGRIQKIIARFEKKLAERAGKSGGKATQAVDDVGEAATTNKLKDLNLAQRYSAETVQKVESYVVKNGRHLKPDQIDDIADAVETLKKKGIKIGQNNEGAVTEALALRKMKLKYPDADGFVLGKKILDSEGRVIGEIDIGVVRNGKLVDIAEVKTP